MRRHNLQLAGLTAAGVALGCHCDCTSRYNFDPHSIVALIRKAIDSGVTLVDCCTASEPAIEPVIGQAIGHGDFPALLSVRAPSRDVRRECDSSLRQLGVDRIDLYYLSPAAGRPVEYLMTAAAELVEAGKIGHIGLSEVSAEQLRQAHAIHPVSALVAEYSLLARQVEGGLLAAAREHSMAVIAYRPLAGGWLTGRFPSADHASYRDRLRSDLRLRSAQVDAAIDQLLLAEQSAAELDLGMSRLALAWLLAQGEDVIPVAGTCDQVHLEMNLASATVRLPSASLARLSARPSDERDRRCGDEPAE